MANILIAGTDKTRSTRLIAVDPGSVVHPVHDNPPDRPPSPNPPRKLVSSGNGEADGARATSAGWWERPGTAKGGPRNPEDGGEATADGREATEGGCGRVRKGSGG